MSILAVHIAAGGAALLAGYVALGAAKGGRLHRKAGIIFVVTMLAMALLGMTQAITRDVAPAVNLSAGSLTVYLVLTALVTLRPTVAGSRPLHLGASVVALSLGLTDLTLAFDTLGRPGGTRDGIPAFPFFLFGTVSLLAAGGDWRVVRSGARQGRPRLARHLWRMSFALFIAALSFFIGQMKVIPKPIRIPGLLALPVLLVLVTMVYWLWRMRHRERAI